MFRALSTGQQGTNVSRLADGPAGCENPVVCGSRAVTAVTHDTSFLSQILYEALYPNFNSHSVNAISFFHRGNSDLLTPEGAKLKSLSIENGDAQWQKLCFILCSSLHDHVGADYEKTTPFTWEEEARQPTITTSDSRLDHLTQPPQQA